MNMIPGTGRKRRLLPLALLALLLAGAAHAASEADWDAAWADARAAWDEAATAQVQWTATEQVMDDARAAADAGDWDEATRLAKRGEALARASLRQAEEQKSLWQDAVIRARD